MSDTQQDQQAGTLPAIFPESGDASLAPMTATAMILDSANMQQIMEFGKFMASGRSTIPEHLRGNPSDCAAIVTQAMMWRMNPYAVAQKTHLVNGQLGYEAQLVNAVIQSSGVTSGRIHYEWFGDWNKVIGKFTIRQSAADPAKGKKGGEYRVPGWSMADEEGLGVRVFATLKGEAEPRVLELLLSQASVRNSPLWATDPKQQLAYLGVKRWSRLFAPDVILGVYTPDELDEASPAGMKDINPAPAGRPSSAKPADIARSRQQAPDGPSPQLLKAAQEAAGKGVTHFKNVYWKALTAVQRTALRPELANLEQIAVKADQPVQPQGAGQVEDVSDFVRDMDRASGVAGADDYVPE